MTPQIISRSILYWKNIQRSRLSLIVERIFSDLAAAFRRDHDAMTLNLILVVDCKVISRSTRKFQMETHIFNSGIRKSGQFYIQVCITDLGWKSSPGLDQGNPIMQATAKDLAGHYMGSEGAIGQLPSVWHYHSIFRAFQDQLRISKTNTLEIRKIMNYYQIC